MKEEARSASEWSEQTSDDDGYSCSDEREKEKRGERGRADGSGIPASHLICDDDCAPRKSPLTCHIQAVLPQTAHSNRLDT